MTIQELEKKNSELEKEIGLNAEKHNLITDKVEPIYDGIYSAEKYLSAPLRIMWVLKEPYDDVDDNGLPAGGGWSIPKCLFNEPDYKYYTSGKVSAKMVTRLSYCLLNNKKFADSKDLNSAQEIAQPLQNIAYINISKMPAVTRTNNATLIEKYNFWKTILLKQIETYSPDVIIFGATFDFFISDLFGESFPEPNFKFGMTKGFVRNDGLLISAYHPGYFKSEETQDNYASEIIKIVNTWKVQKDNKNESNILENKTEYRTDCVVDCLKEMEKQLHDAFGADNIERAGNGGDDIYWGRWTDKETTPDLIAEWLLDKARQGYIGYKIYLNNDFNAEIYLYGDAKSFYTYIFPVSENTKKLIDLNYDSVKKHFGTDGIGWWMPDKDKLNEIGWILGRNYEEHSFDFRNASMEKAEYKEAYQKFKATAFQGMISGRDNSIIKTVEELKNFIELN